MPLPLWQIPLPCLEHVHVSGHEPSEADIEPSEVDVANEGGGWLGRFSRSSPEPKEVPCDRPLLARQSCCAALARSPPCLLVAQVEPSPEAAEPLEEEEASRVPEIPKCESLSGSPVEVSPRGFLRASPLGT